jgi:cobalamin biosynthesis protein CobW
MSTDYKVPVNILTGFLGSGKTTLLRELLGKNQGRKKIAILMNEIGEISIDAKLLEGFSMDLFELNDGCICCSVNENFVEAMDEIAAKASPDLIIIETTGVANPISIIYSLLNPHFILDAVITTVDVKNFRRLLLESSVAEEQLEAADIIILTKTDVASEKEIAETEVLVREKNSRSKVFWRNMIEPELIFGVAYPRESLEPYQSPHANGEHHHFEAEGIETFRFESFLVFELELLQKVLESLPNDLWRLKGTVHLSGQSTAFILNYAYGRYTLDDYSGEATGCDLIFIGKHLSNHKQKLISFFTSTANQDRED